MYGGVLSLGIGDAIANQMEGLRNPVILAVYLVAVLLRIAQGSATVALTTAAGLMAPAVWQETSRRSRLQLSHLLVRQVQCLHLT